MDNEHQKELNEKLINAARCGDITQMKQLLAAGADANAKDETGWTALHWSASAKNIQSAALLIETGADVNAVNDYGETALFWAVHHNYKDVAQMLISAGADVNVRDKDGWTALHWSARYGETDSMQLLIENGADINARNKDSLTPADILAEKYPRLYKEHIDSLMDARPESRRLKSEDADGVPEGTAVTGFEFDI